jgi:EmrB/QacA subfamily drug resistance transporter
MLSLFVAEKAPSKWLVLISACLGLGLLTVDLFAVNVALPSMARDLEANLDTVQWVVSGYILMAAVLPIAAGRMGDIFGRREVYLVGLVLFVSSSVACAFASSIYVLIGFRLVQGTGAAIMQPATLSIVTNAFPERERGVAVGIWGGISALGLILGPVLGGVLVEGFSWRLIFLINLPIGLLALFMALRYIRTSRDESAPRLIDIPGVAVLSGALFLVMFAVTRGNAEGWGSPMIVGFIVTGAVMLPLFVLIERRSRFPLVDLSLFQSGPFVMACLATFLFAAAIFGSQPYTSLFMQSYWRFTPLEGGLAFLPSTVLIALLMPFSGIMGQRLGHRLRFIVMAGSISVALSFLYQSRLGVGDGYFGAFLPAFLMRGAGVGLFLSATLLAAVSAAPAAKSGLAAGTVTMFRNIGTSIGVAVLGAVYLHHVTAQYGDVYQGAEPNQVAELTAAASRFVPSGDGAVRLVSEQLIVDGFVLVSIACLVIAVVATIAASFIRYKSPAEQPDRTVTADVEVGQTASRITPVDEPIS